MAFKKECLLEDKANKHEIRGSFTIPLIKSREAVALSVKGDHYRFYVVVIARCLSFKIRF